MDFIPPATVPSTDDFVYGKVEKNSKISLVIKPAIIESLNGCFRNTNFAFIQNKDISCDEIGACTIIKESGASRVSFQSALECLEAILKYNGRNALNVGGSDAVMKKIVFVCPDSNANCTLGEPLNVSLTTNGQSIRDINQRFGFVPFKKLNPSVFDIAVIKSFVGVCLNCQYKYHLIGVDIDLNFIAARCGKCKNEWTLENLSPIRRGETFVRLVELYDQQGNIILGVQFKPCRISYESCRAFSEILQPMVTWEWKQIVYQLRAKQCTGLLKASAPIEEVTGGVSATLLEIILLETSRFWNPSYSIFIEALTIQLLVQLNNEMKIIETSTTEFDIKQDQTDTKLLAVVKIRNTMEFLPASQVKIIPYPSSTKYAALSGFLKNLANGSINNDLISSLMDLKNLKLDKPPMLDISRQLCHAYFRNGYEWIIQKLNPHQLAAYNYALLNQLTVIYGGAGTGKTSALASIVTNLNLLNPNARAIATGFNDAVANKLASVFASVHAKLFTKYPPYHILRVFSKHQEMIWQSSKKIPVFGEYVRVLHLEVEERIKCGKNDKLQIILQCLFDGTFFQLPSSDKVYWREETLKIERDLIGSSRHRVIVCDYETLLEDRFRARDNPSSKLNIDWVVVDDCNALKHLELLFTLNMGQSRTIIAGDTEGWGGKTVNLGVVLGGYAYSTLDLILKGKSKIPTVKLQEQYRLRTEICKLVSGLFYNAIPLKSTMSKVPPGVRHALQTKKSVLVLDYHGQEEKVGNSFRNPIESKMTVDICNRLLENGIKPSEISVLAFYREQRIHVQASLSPLDINVTFLEHANGLVNDVVIVNFTRAGNNGIGLCQCSKRVNLALTRAEKMLVLLLHKDTFKKSNDKFIKKFLTLIEEIAENKFGFT